jgi:hypothetical protein
MFAVAATVLWAGQVQAQEQAEAPTGGPTFTEGVRPSGMGLAYTGVATGASAIFHNPGGIASRMMYQVEGTYEYNPAGSVLNASIVDSKTNPDIAAGVSYSYFFGRGDYSNSSGHSARLAVALPVLPERISVGLAGRYLNVHVEDVQVVHTVTVDAGILFRATDRIQIGVAGQNLVDVCDRDDLCGSVAPTTIAGGLSFGDESSFMLAADGGIDLTSDPEEVQPFFEVGAEYFAGGTVPIRLGFQRQQFSDQNFLTGGLGVRLQTAGLDGGFRMDLNDTDNFYANGSVSIYF